MITCYGDSDHASDVETRRSTVGQVIMLGTHCVKHCCKLWSQIGLSSAELRKRDVYVLKKDLEQFEQLSESSDTEDDVRLVLHVW